MSAADERRRHGRRTPRRGCAAPLILLRCDSSPARQSRALECGGHAAAFARQLHPVDATSESERPREHSSYGRLATCTSTSFDERRHLLRHRGYVLEAALLPPPCRPRSVRHSLVRLCARSRRRVAGVVRVLESLPPRRTGIGTIIKGNAGAAAFGSFARIEQSSTRGWTESLVSVPRYAVDVRAVVAGTTEVHARECCETRPGARCGAVPVVFGCVVRALCNSRVSRDAGAVSVGQDSGC